MARFGEERIEGMGKGAIMSIFFATHNFVFLLILAG